METGKTSQGKRQILQLTPANGWAVVCVDDDGETTAVPLIAWALTRSVVPAPSGCTGSTECTGIHGVVVSAAGTGVSFADSLEGFVSYDFVGSPPGEVLRLGGSKLWVRFLPKSPSAEDEEAARLALASFIGWPVKKLGIRMVQLGLRVQDWWMCEPADRQLQAEDAAIEHGTLVDLRREPPEEGWPVHPKDEKDG